MDVGIRELKAHLSEYLDRVVELDAGHHPFLSRPAAVRDLIVAL